MPNPYRDANGKYSSKDRAAYIVRSDGTLEPFNAVPATGSRKVREDGDGVRQPTMSRQRKQAARVGIDPDAIMRAEISDDGMIGLEIGSTGLKAAGGVVLEERLPELRWPLAPRVFREMGDNDAVCGALLNTVDLTMRRANWSVQPADESNAAAVVAELIESMLFDMADTWDDTLSSILSMLSYGFGLHEMVWKRRLGFDPGFYPDGTPKPVSKYKDGKVGWDHLPIRSQDTIIAWHIRGVDFTRDATKPEYVSQVIPTSGQRDLPYDKLLHFRTSSLKGNPLGFSIFRRAWRSWVMKRRYEEIEAVGIERDLAGVPTAYMPVEYLVGLTPRHAKVRDLMREAVIHMHRNESEGLLMPQEYDRSGHEMFKFELLTTGGKRQFDIGASITRAEQRMLMTALADFLMLGHEGVGSLGVNIGVSRIDMFVASVETWLRGIANEVSSVGFTKLMRMNGLPLELTPTLEPGTLQQTDVAEAATTILTLSQAGDDMFPDSQIGEYFLDLLGVPHDDRATRAEGGSVPMKKSDKHRHHRTSRPRMTTRKAAVGGRGR